MIDSEKTYLNIIRLLDENQVDYKLFTHRAALSYEDLAKVKKEAGFFGTEGKCMFLKIDDKFIVYVTTQDNRVSFDTIKTTLKENKIRLATPEELKSDFGDEPGCAYPFGFLKDVDIC